MFILLIISSIGGMMVYYKDKMILASDPKIRYRELWNFIRHIILLLNTMIPLSLQFFFITASRNYSRRLESLHQVTVNSNGLTALQINPDYIGISGGALRC